MSFRKWLALLLVLCLTAGLLPTATTASASAADNDAPRVFTEADNAVLQADVFAKIDAVEAKAAKRGPRRAPARTEKDYNALVPQVIEAIESSDTYVEGTLQNNDGFLVWETTVGLPACYSPDMEAKLNGVSAEPEPDAVALASLEASVRKMKKTSSLRGTDDGGESDEAEPMNIGLIQPFWESNDNYLDEHFCTYSQYYVDMAEILREATGGELIRYTMQDATVDNVAYTLEECGLVVIDSHGAIDGPYAKWSSCNYLALSTSAGITAEDTAPRDAGNGYTYYECMVGEKYTLVSGTVIADHMTKDAPDSLLYMGMCYGMATDGMIRGLRDRGVHTFWGYTQAVSFYGEACYMTSVLANLYYGDLFWRAVQKTKADYGRWDPAYPNISETSAIWGDIAHPVCVSPEDPYPQGDIFYMLQNTVRSRWALYEMPESNLVAEPDDVSHGSVSVEPSGYGTFVVTATAKAGWVVSGYEIVSGDVTVEVLENNKKYEVTVLSEPTETCVVRINYSEMTSLTVPFVSNGRVVYLARNYLSYAITLPDAQYADRLGEDWTFVGWADRQVAETTDQPHIYAPGSRYVLRDSVTFYAVYRKITGYSIASETYVPLTSAPSDWSGRHIIATTRGFEADAMRGLPDDCDLGSSVMVLSSCGEQIPEQDLMITGTSPSILFDMEPVSGGRYRIRNVNCETYAVGYKDGSSYTLLSLDDPLNDALHGSDWKLSMRSDGTVSFSVNINGSEISLGTHFSYGHNWFDLSSGAGSALTVWGRAPLGDTYYTTGAEMSEWAVLQSSVNYAKSGTELCLISDVTAAPEDAALTVPAGKSVTLRLTDCALDRGLSEARADGQVIAVRGSLTLTGTGTVTGGCSSGNGGGVLVDGGSFTLEGGSVTGNTARNGGGVATQNGGQAYLNGGAVTDNTADGYGGGVWIGSGSSCTLPGSGITGNTAADGGGVFCEGPLALRENLTDGVPRGVTGNTPNDLAPTDDPSVIRHYILLGSNIRTCALTAEPAFAAPGQTVILTPEPAEGFALLTQTVTCGNNAIDTRRRSDGNVSFVMPDSVVKAEGLFVPTPTAANGSTLNLYTPSAFFIWDGIEHGTVSAKRVSGTETIPVDADGSGALLNITSRKTFRLTATPDEGYVLKEWRIESTNEDGAPDGKYVIPVAGDNTFVADKYREPYQVFRISAVFTEGEPSYEIKVNNNDLTGKGNYAAADVPEALSGETVNVSVHLEPGCKVYGIWDAVTQTERLYDVYYRSKNTGRLEKIPLASTDALRFSFTVPEDIDPGDRAVYVTVVFDNMEDPVAVSFLAGDGVGEMDDVIVERGSGYALPACGFAAPENAAFDRWSVRIGDAQPVDKAPGDEITVTADTSVTAVWITNWAALQRSIDNAPNDTTVTLDKNITATAADTALVIPTDKTLTIDLNGFTLDRNLPQAREDGSVLKVFGTLTLTDGSVGRTGAVTGGSTTIGGGGIRVENGGTLLLEGGTVTGNAARNGGGVLNQGVLTVAGGEISGNTAVDSGGGVFNNTQGVMALNGSRITGNTAETLYGGGVHSQGTLELAGSPVVTGNNRGGETNNVCLFNDTVIEITGTLSETALVGVNRGNGSPVGVIARGLSENGKAMNFQSDDSHYAVAVDGSGDACLRYVYTAEWSWADDYSAATATLTRLADGSWQTVEAGITSEEVSGADCEHDQVVHFTATVALDGMTYTDTTEDITVPNTATGHRFTSYVYQNDATCTENGTEIAVCDNGCGKTDTREAADTATGHAYGAPIWNWTDDFNAAVTFTCVHGDDTRTPYVTVTNRVTAEPTATADGKRVYTAAAVFNGVTYSDTKEEVLPATGMPDEPESHTDPDQPSGEKRCKWCDQVHTGFWGSIVGFFHSILWFFAHLFGKR